MKHERVVIRESGMNFGPFGKEDLFLIEKSEVRNSLGRGFKSVEFICLCEGCIYFIEVKNSSPKPSKENKEKFDDFIDDISVKFIDAFQIFLSSLFRRNDTAEIGEEICSCDFSEINIKYCVVISGHKIEWLPPIQEALNRRLAKVCKVWKMKAFVINDVIARQRRLIA